MKYSETVFIGKITLLCEMLENESDTFHNSTTNTTKSISISTAQRIIGYLSEEVEIFFTHLTKNNYYNHFNDIYSTIKDMQKAIEIIEESQDNGGFLFYSDAVDIIKRYVETIKEFDFSSKNEDTETTEQKETETNNKILIQLIDNCSNDIYYANIDNNHLNILQWLQDEVLLFDKANINIKYGHKINIKEL